MSKERTLANIAKMAYWDTQSENKDTFDRVAKAVEKEVLKRRVAPKKVNDPDDPTTWEKGVAIFARDREDEVWDLDVFSRYKKILILNTARITASGDMQNSQHLNKLKRGN